MSQKNEMLLVKLLSIIMKAVITAIRGENMTDNQLLQQLQLGQPEFMEMLLQKYYRYVYTIIANILGARGTHEDIEELAQDTFYAVWSHANMIHGKFRSYLSTTARNKALSWLQRQQELPMALDTIEISDFSGSLEDLLQREDVAQTLTRAIDGMRPKDREIFLRFYFYMQTAEDISQRMGLSPNAIRLRLMRGRKTLQKILNKEDFL